MSLYDADCLAGRSTGAAPSQKSHAGYNVLDCGVELSGDGFRIHAFMYTCVDVFASFFHRGQDRYYFGECFTITRMIESHFTFTGNNIWPPEDYVGEV